MVKGDRKMDGNYFFAIVVGIALGIGLLGMSQCTREVDVVSDYQSCLNKCPTTKYKFK